MFLKRIFLFTIIFVCDICCVNLFQNDICSTNNQDGHCLSIENCPAAIQGIKKGIHPTTCSFVGKKPIVCCIQQNGHSGTQNGGSNQNGGQWGQNGGSGSQNEGSNQNGGQWGQNGGSGSQNEGSNQNGGQWGQNGGSGSQNGGSNENGGQWGQNGGSGSQNGGSNQNGGHWNQNQDQWNSNSGSSSQNGAPIQNEDQWDRNKGSATQNSGSGSQNGDQWGQNGQNPGQWSQNQNQWDNNKGSGAQNGASGSGQLTQTRKKLHEEMCQRFLDEINSKKVEDENDFFVSVVGGTAAKVGEFPHMALLGYGNKDKISWSCGGSLISKEYILTAAHCLRHPTLGEVQHVRLGDIYINGSAKSVQNFQVVQRIIHPEYRAPLIYNDIALLRLDRQVTFTDDVKPACFHPTKDVEGILEVKATGWGLTEFGGNPANILQTVDLDIFNHTECQATYRNNKRRIPNGILDDRQICAGGREREQDTCQGDSGGPLQWRQNGWEDLYKIIGVTSLGKGCGTISVPAIYTKVVHYIPWIENIVFK